MHVQALGRDEGGFLSTVEIHHADTGMDRLLRHLQRLPGLAVKGRRSWPLTDDSWITLTWRGHELTIESPFVHYWIERQRDCPDDVFQELLDHVGTLRTSLLRRCYLRLRGIVADNAVPQVAP